VTVLSAAAATRVPVVVGIGEVLDRTHDPLQAKEPLELMSEAMRGAAADACGARGVELLESLDSLDIVCEYSWPYVDACASLCMRLNITPARAEYGPPGGESPVRYIHEAALRIAAGRSVVAAVVGAEAGYSAPHVAKAGAAHWSPRDTTARLLRGADLCHPLAVRHGAEQPVRVYPFYENATQARWGQSQGEALRESGELWSHYSSVAAGNPFAWLGRHYTVEEIITPSADNRLIAWPYTKHMAANPSVNQGAAVLVTSLDTARRLSVPEDRLVYVWGGASASEPRDYLGRDQFDRCAAQEAVLEAALGLGGGDISRFTALELYSCFPVVPKMARRTLGLAADAQTTAIGGLSFFGAPLNNYMTHAAAGLVRHLRQQPGKLALLYGQGEFLTKHHALILASCAPRDATLMDRYSVQEQADRNRAAPPELVLDYAGPARLETFTVIYNRAGTPEHGVVIGRTPQGARLMARVDGADSSSIAFLTDLSTCPIGTTGSVRRGGADGLLTWVYRP
jgi:acetyl-CoA C-acetyltransferase